MTAPHADDVARGAISRLITIAAALARGDGLPSDFAEDYGRKTLSASVVAHMMEGVRDAAKERAIAIGNASDQLSAALAALKAQCVERADVADAERIRADEREACAKLCLHIYGEALRDESGKTRGDAIACAAAIRARP